MTHNVELWNKIDRKIPDLEPHEVDWLHDLVLTREAAEREACADVAENYDFDPYSQMDWPQGATASKVCEAIAAAIRARGEEEG